MMAPSVPTITIPVLYQIATNKPPSFLQAMA
jgi:hypothetical protein